MPKRIYVGSHAEVEMLLPSGEVVTVARGAAHEFPDDVAKELDASAAWKTTTSTGKAADTSEKEQ